MNKSDRIKGLRIGNYLRELSVVIIGVAVTLYAGNLITAYQQNRDMKLQLDIVYAELEDNVKKLDPVIFYHEELEKLRGFMLAKYLNPFPAVNDSILKYSSAASHSHSYTYKKNAYEMFINSGAMKFLTDRRKLLDITESYTLLEELKYEHDEYIDSKMKVFHELYKVETEIIVKSTLIQPEEYVMYNFHMLTSGMKDKTVKVKEELERVISERYK